MRKAAYILLLMLCLPLWVLAQLAYDRKDPASILNALDSRYAQLDSMIFMPAQASTAPYSRQLVDADAATEREQAVDQAIGERVQAEISEFKSNLGVQLTGQAYYRLDGVLGDDEDDPQSRYNGKLQIEARWYILQSSLFKRQGHIRALQLQGDIDRTERQRDRLDLSVYRQKEYFRHVSDSMLAGVLLHHIENLALLTDANLYLLERGDVSSDELLKVLDDKAEAERTLATLIPGARAATDLSGVDACVIEVDTAALIHHIEASAVDLRLLQLRLDLLEQQEQNTSYWSDFRMAPFVRYSYYGRDYAPNSSNIDAGLSFTIPVNTTAAHHRRTLAAERQVLQAEGADLLRQVTDRVRYYATEIQRLNRASMGEVHRIDELKGYLSVRARAYDNSEGGYNRLTRLKEYNNYLVSLERLITFQYQRDCYVADLQRLLNYGSILDYCTIESIAPGDGSTRTLSIP